MRSRFPGSYQFIHEASATTRRRCITEDGLQLDDGVFVHHGTSFGDGTLARVELYLNELHFVSQDLVVDHIGFAN